MIAIIIQSTMELTQFRSYRFESLGEIYNECIHRNQYYLAHYRFSQEEYVNKMLPLGWSDLKALIFYQFSYLTVGSGLLMSFLEYTEFANAYNGFVRHCFGIKQPNKLSLCYLIIISEMFLVSFMSSKWVLTYTAQMFNYMYHYRRYIDAEPIMITSGGREKRKLIDNFVHVCFVLGWNVKCLMVFLVCLNIKISMTIASFCLSGGMSPANGLKVWVFSTYLYGVLASILQSFYIVVVCALWMLKVLKVRVKGLLKVSKKLTENWWQHYRKLFAFRKSLMMIHR